MGEKEKEEKRERRRKKNKKKAEKKERREKKLKDVKFFFRGTIFFRQRWIGCDNQDSDFEVRKVKTKRN